MTLWILLALVGIGIALLAWVSRNKFSSWLTRSLTMLAGLILIVSVLLRIALPVWQLHEPSGHHPVGTAYRFLHDDSRTEDETPDPSDKRQIGIRLWYPAASSSDDKARLWGAEPGRDQILASALRLPEEFGVLFSHLQQVQTHSAAEVPVAEGKHPVLIFSHALNFGFSGQNTQLMESLASHGFLIVAIDHAYWGLYLRLPNGRVAHSKNVQQRFDALWRQDDTPEFAAATSPLMGELDESELDEVLRRAVQLRPQASKEQQRGLELWSDDQRFVLDVLAELATDDELLKDHLQLDQIALMGMSFGASAAGLTCGLDERCKALVAIDGFQPVQINHSALTVPSLHVANAKNFMSVHPFYKARATTYLLQVPDTEHMNFSDVALLSPFLEGVPPFLGSADPDQVLRSLEVSTLAFLNTELLEHTPSGSAPVAQACNGCTVKRRMDGGKPLLRIKNP